MNQQAPSILFNKSRQMQNLGRAKANAPNGNDFLLDYAVTDFQDRLQFVQRDFNLAIDLFGRNGKLSQMLQNFTNIKAVQRYEEDAYIYDEHYIAPKHIRSDDNLGLEVDTADLIISAFALHWSNDLIGDLIQIRRGLNPDGLFLGLIPGAGTLQELRQCLLTADSEIYGGACVRVDPFADVRDMGAAMQRAKFAMPVVDVDTITVRYAHPMKLIHDLRHMGATSALIREHPRANKAFMRRMCEIYQEQFSDDDGRIRATFSFISLSGWAPAENQPQPLKPGSATTRLADVLKTK
jgi:SAM-dependent methyltransferase